MLRTLRKNKKGMSIVVSTIIIVAISITMAIAVSFWAMGIGNSFTKFEKLEIQSAYADSPQVVPSLGSGATARINALDANNGISLINGIIVTNGGSGYTNGASVRIISATGSGFTGTVLVNAQGAVISIAVRTSGAGYSLNDQVQITSSVSFQSYFYIYLRVKNTGSAAATINNVFLNGKPYDAPSVNAPLPRNLIGVPLSVGTTIGARPNYSIIYLPNGSTWNSGDYVEVELETVAGRLYSTTVVLP